MAQYVEAVEDIPTVIDLVDLDSDKWRQYASKTTFPFSHLYSRAAHCLRAYERRICERAACVIVTTEREAQLVRGLSDSIRVQVVSMGIDGSSFSPAPSPSDPHAPTIVFTGVMNYFPNEDAVCFFANQVFPLIRQSVPSARFLIVGRSPSRMVRQLGKRDGIEVTGSVPDVRPYLAQASVSVAPFSIAAGIQSKILEALAFGLPVVATPRAVQALEKDVADIIATGETAEALASHVVCLLRDPQLAERKSIEGRRRVAASYSWESALLQLLRLVEDPRAGTVTTPVLDVARSQRRLSA
jgi:sugar transferase (PEP-CTERM/EpsH1 system associated)